MTNMMQPFLKSLTLSAGLLIAAHGFAQTPVTTPTTSPSAPSMKSTASMNTSAVKPVKSTKAEGSKVDKKAPMAEAPGGGAGKVWVNSASKTYHCPGSKYYGKTKKGEYMTEVEAKTKGNHADHKTACA
jgi:hypothetical protein